MCQSAVRERWVCFVKIRLSFTSNSSAVTWFVVNRRYCTTWSRLICVSSRIRIHIRYARDRRHAERRRTIRNIWGSWWISVFSSSYSWMSVHKNPRSTIAIDTWCVVSSIEKVRWHATSWNISRVVSIDHYQFVLRVLRLNSSSKNECKIGQKLWWLFYVSTSLYSIEWELIVYTTAQKRRRTDNKYTTTEQPKSWKLVSDHREKENTAYTLWIETADNSLSESV
jgi:hypothetical protein